VAGIATLLVAGACTSVTLPSIPPINIPGGTIPPINVPGGTVPPINIPTLPPINLPSGITLPSGLVIPPIALPTSETPCTLVTAAEAAQILGSAVTDSSSSPTDCTFISQAFSTVSISTDNSTDFTGARFLLGSSAQDTTVGGFPALAGTAFGVPAVYVQKPTGQLTVLGFLGSDPAIITKLQQIATVAVGRMP